jgi:hypothetical protein
MTSQRILLAGGLLLFLLSAFTGLYYDLILRPEQHTAVSYTLDMALNMATKGDPAMAAAFAGEFASLSLLQEIQARLPSHLAFAGAAAIAPVWIVAKLDISERMKQMLALLIVAGGLLLGAGDILQSMGYSLQGRYVVLGGYAWIALGLSAFSLYAGLFIWLHTEPQSKRR